MGKLKNIERPETGLFSLVVENGKLKFVSHAMANNTLEVAYLSPVPEWKVAADVGVQSIETLFY